MSVCHAKNVCQAQHNMQQFFLYIKVINNMLLLFLTVILVIIDNQSNFRAFLVHLDQPKKMSQVLELDV